MILRTLAYIIYIYTCHNLLAQQRHDMLQIIYNSCIVALVFRALYIAICILVDVHAVIYVTGPVKTGHICT